MGWICEECGYENEFSELAQITTCDCCGEPASENVKTKAWEKLNSKRLEEERRLKAIEEERLAKVAQARFERHQKAIISFSRSVKKAVTAIVLVSVNMIAIWAAVTINSSNDSITNFYDNIKHSSLSYYSDNVKENTSITGSQIDSNYQKDTENIRIIGDTTISRSNNASDNMPLVVVGDTKHRFDFNVASLCESVLRRLIAFMHL